MIYRLSSTAGLLALCIAVAGCERPVSFARDVNPIFQDHCAECHKQAGEGVAASGFAVSDYKSVMTGTKFGQVVVPGSSMSSSLYLMVAGKTAPEILMPPQHEQSLATGRGIALSDKEIQVIGKWIDQGAKDN